MTDTPDLQAAIQAAIKDSRRPLKPGEAQPMRPGPRVQVGRESVAAAASAVATAPAVATASAVAAVPRRRARIGLWALTAAVLLLLGAALAFKLQIYQGALGPGGNPGFGDFDLFRLVGRMGLTGHMADAYNAGRLGAAQLAAGGAAQPWISPPPFGLLAMGLALLPPAEGFALFLGLPLAIYLVLLWLLSGQRPVPALILSAPALLTAVLGGQAGLLTATLAGFFALAALRGWVAAGLPLGLLAIEPHLALGLGLLAVFRRNWRVVKIALATLLLGVVVVTWLLGPGIWSAFASGLGHAAGATGADGLRLSRLISVFATARGAGLTLGEALMLQGIAGLIAAAVLFWAVLHGLGLRAELGLAMLVALTLSPFGLDADLPLFGLAAALLWPLLQPRMRRIEGGALAVLAFIAGGTGLALALAMPDKTALEHLVEAGRFPLPVGPALLLALLWSALILRRTPR